MPALAVTLPAYHVGQDLQDADSPVDRQIASALASASVVLSVLGAIVDAGYPRPGHVSAAEASAYQTNVGDAKAAAKTLVDELLAIYKV